MSENGAMSERSERSEVRGRIRELMRVFKKKRLIKSM